MLNDLRYAARALGRAPGFTFSAIVALALGIGANTAVFSVVYAVMLKPLPYPASDRLVRLYEASPVDGITAGDVSTGTFIDWRARSRTLDGLAMYMVPLGGETLWTTDRGVQVVRAASVSPTLFGTLGVQPVRGRTFTSDLDLRQGGGIGQFVISYGLWQRAFGGAADIVGRRVVVEGRLPREIIGVMPRGFDVPAGTDAWIALPFQPVAPADRRLRSGPVIARLAAGRTIDDARRELQDISAQLATEQPVSNRGWTADVEPLAGADAKTLRLALIALSAAVAGVLLIGCANVANLLLARAVGSRRELTVRMALGAGAWRLFRLALAEAIVLAGGGVVAGLLIGDWMTKILVHLAPPDVPRLAEVAVTWPVFLFATAAGILAAVITALAPALHTVRAELRVGLRSDVRAATDRSAPARRWLIAGEVAVVVLLLSGALLLVRTFVKLRGVDLGFQADHVVEIETRWPIGTLFGHPGQQWPRVQHAVDGLLAAVSGVPGVQAVGVISDVPLAGAATEATVWRTDAAGADRDHAPVDAAARWKCDLAVVSPGYFASLGIPVLRGRSFTGADRFTDDQLVQRRARTGVVLVDAAFAERYFPHEDPVGHVLVFPEANAFADERVIVGVVGNVRTQAVAEPPHPTAYFPHAQNPDIFRPSLLVRSALPLASISEAIRARVAAYDPALVILRMRPMGDLVSGSLSRPRFNLLLLSSFALVALALSAIGIYGVLAYLVTQRTREIGIRIALGARPAAVGRLLVREGMLPVLSGAAIGVAASVLAARAIRALLFGVTPLDTLSLAGAPILLALIAFVACYLPARRALRIDPVNALRAE